MAGPDTPHQIALKAAIEYCESRSELSSRTGISLTVMSELASGKVPMKPWMAVMLEYATDGRVKRARSMPEVFGPVPRRKRKLVEDADPVRDTLLAALRAANVRAKTGGGPDVTRISIDRLMALRDGPVDLSRGAA